MFDVDDGMLQLSRRCLYSRIHLMHNTCESVDQWTQVNCDTSIRDERIVRIEKVGANHFLGGGIDNHSLNGHNELIVMLSECSTG